MVQYSVGDLIGHLVGMSFGDGFRGKEVRHVALVLFSLVVDCRKSGVETLL